MKKFGCLGLLGVMIVILQLICPVSSLPILEKDIECLNSIHTDLKDPQDNLYTWNFANTTKGFICNFLGITCWHNDDNKVVSIWLPQMGLQGIFPSGVKYCGSMTSLSLSQNNLTGTIPKDLCLWLPYLITLDISQNQFTGIIPFELHNCTYLNVLHLNGNQFTGPVPWQLTRLDRLKDLNVAGNKLSGAIPTFSHNFSASNFQNNPGLCGFPLSKACGKENTIGISIGAAVAGVVVVSLLGFAFWCCFIRRSPKKLAEMKDENKGANRIRAPKSIPVSMFEKSIKKIKLSDLLDATNDFSQENIIMSGRTGTVYRATLADGFVMAIKRLRDTVQSGKLFTAEVNTLAHLRHRNLVPLLGYQIAGHEKLLVYKHMANGSLWDCLHSKVNPENNLDWPTRLKVGIGAARGMAWLHHGCNPRVIHRNISSQSILLDEGYQPRITDFGLASLMDPADSHLSTFNSADSVDLAYAAPEYIHTMLATLKGDVYSFGVVLLELVTGQKPFNIENGDDSFNGNLVDWITQLSNNGRINEAIDKSLLGREQDDELLQFMRVACVCVLSIPKERPSMYEVYHFLRGIGEKYSFADENDEILLASGTTTTTETDYTTEIDISNEVIVSTV